MSCKARLAARAARTFAAHRGAKVTAFFAEIHAINVKNLIFLYGKP
jgi:hypothetical protein